MNGYDQWKTESPYNDDMPNQTINDKLCDGTILIGYGKVGHGMNGKDADLDRVGQCLVKELVTEDPIGENSMRVAIHLTLYACVYSPSYENLDYYREESSEEFKEVISSLGKNFEDDDDLLEILEEQAQCIIEGVHWDINCNNADEDGWYFNNNAVLYVPLSVDEYEEIEDGNEKTLEVVANRIYKEICDANQGGYEGRDIVKLFEEEIGMANDMINNICK